LAVEVLGERSLEIYIGNWRMIPSRGGTFELTVNGELLFSKKTLGRHAEPGEIKALIQKKLAQVREAQRG
jgi:selenoprotein W-related protein